MHPCICHHGATDKLPSISVVSLGIDQSPRQKTKKCNSKIWLEDPTPKRILTKWCRCLPGSHFGKSYRIKFKKIWRATNMHVCLLLGPTMKRSLVFVLFTFKKRPKEREGINAFKLGNTFLTPRAVCTVYLKNKVDRLSSISYARTACSWNTLVINVLLSQGWSGDI